MSEANKVVERWRLEEQREQHRAALVRALTGAMWAEACQLAALDYAEFGYVPGPLICSVAAKSRVDVTPSQLADDLLGIPPR